MTFKLRTTVEKAKTILFQNIWIKNKLYHCWWSSVSLLLEVLRHCYCNYFCCSSNFNKLMSQINKQAKFKSFPGKPCPTPTKGLLPLVSCRVLLLDHIPENVIDHLSDLSPHHKTFWRRLANTVKFRIITIFFFNEIYGIDPLIAHLEIAQLVFCYGKLHLVPKQR